MKNEYVIKKGDYDIYFSYEHLLLLTERERKVLEFRFLPNGNKRNTLEEVGKLIGSVSNKNIPINIERVSQIEKKALRKLSLKDRHIKIVIHYNSFNKWREKYE